VITISRLSKGVIVEEGATSAILSKPKAAYTRSLLASRALSAAYTAEEPDAALDKTVIFMNRLHNWKTTQVYKRLFIGL